MVPRAIGDQKASVDQQVRQVASAHRGQRATQATQARLASREIRARGATQGLWVRRVPLETVVLLALLEN